MKKIFVIAAIALFSASASAGAGAVQCIDADEIDYSTNIQMQVVDGSGDTISSIAYVSPKATCRASIVAMNANTAVLAAGWTKLLVDMPGDETASAIGSLGK